VRKLGAVLTVATCVVVSAGGIATTSASAAVSSTPAPAVAVTTPSFASSALHKTLPKQVIRLGPAIPGSGGTRLVKPRVTLADPITAKINVQYSGFPAQARTAFQAAVDIWARTVHSSVAIDVLADWSNLSATYGPDVLGAAGPSDFVANFTDAAHAKANVFYPVALANAITGKDQLTASACLSDNKGNTSGAEILASFNSSPAKPWYFGTDGAVDIRHVDLESVVLHELAHGLGFVGTFDGLNPVTGADEGKGYVGLTGTGTQKVIFDTFITDGAAHGLPWTGAPNASLALGDDLRGDHKGANWNGANGKAAYSGQLVPLYSPYPWEEGSSFSHLDDESFPGGNVNALMTPQLSPGESEHNPGPILLGILKDMGWPTAATVPGPVGYYHAVAPVPISRLAHQTGVKAGAALDLGVVGHFGVPAGVTSVLVNVEIKAPTATGFWSALPGCRGGPGIPDVGDYSTGQSRTGQVSLPVNRQGHIQVSVSAGAAEVNVDLVGWYSTSGDYYHHLQDQQVADLTTVNAAQPVDVQVAGKAGIPASGATAVVFKARVSAGSAKGYLAVGPGGKNSQIPTLSYAAGEMISNLLTVPLGTGSAAGKVHLRVTAGRATVSLEAVGWYGASSAAGLVFHPAGPARLQGLKGQDQVIGGLPDSTRVMLTVHLSATTSSGWLGSSPAGPGGLHGVQEYRRGVPVSGTIITTTNALGQVRLRLSSGTATMYVDGLGWFASS
jgi:hypothetical protein